MCSHTRSDILHSCSIRFSNSIQNTSIGTGFSSAVDNMLFQSVNFPSCAERERWIILLMDEMHIRENLVKNKHTGLYNVLYNGICLFTRLCILQRLSLVSLTWEMSTITWQPMRNALKKIPHTTLSLWLQWNLR